LDILKPLNIDPLFQCDYLKRQVAQPEDLLPMIEKLYSMKDEQFINEQSLSREYLKEYFCPVDEEHLKSFLNG
jgi:hypothetical protein